MQPPFDTRWTRSEPIDLTVGDATLRLVSEAILPCSAGNVVARLRNDGVDRTFVARAYEPIFGDFVVIRKTSTTATPLYAVNRTLPSGAWLPDHDRGLVLWVAADDPNVVTATPYAPDRSDVTGLSKASTVSWSATAFNGVLPAFVLGGGRLQTPVGAGRPICASTTGSRKAFVLVAALNWTNLTANKGIFCLGNSVGGHTSIMSIETVGAGPGHRFRRVNTSGVATNFDCGDTIPPAGTPYMLSVFYHGRLVTLRVNGTTVGEHVFNRDPIESDQFVIGAVLSGGSFSGAILGIKVGEVVGFASHDLPSLRSSFGSAEAYIQGKWL